MDSNICLNYMGIFLKLSSTVCIDEFCYAGIAVEKSSFYCSIQYTTILFFLEKIYASLCTIATSN